MSKKEIKQSKYIEDKIESLEEVNRFDVVDSGDGWISGCIIFEIDEGEQEDE